MKKTLLEIVQEILTEMDSDEVNSYTDSTESLAVANIVQNAYWDIVSQASFPKMFTPFELVASGDVSKPSYMTIPEGFSTLAWLRYDESTIANPDAGYRQLVYEDPQVFMQRMYGMDKSASNVVSYELTLDNGDTLDVRCQNDGPPTIYTSLDDNIILFNSYDADVDATLQADKSLAYGERIPTFTMDDAFVPDLPERQFTILRNEAKATAFASLKQAQNANAERKARRGWITSQKTARKINNPRRELDRVPNYGR